MVKGESGLCADSPTEKMIRLDQFHDGPGSSGGDGCAKPRQSTTDDHYVGSLGDRLHEPETIQELSMEGRERKMTLSASNDIN